MEINMRYKNLSTIVLAVSIVLLAACGKKEESGDKKAELEQLKSQQQEIASKIEALERELGVQNQAKADNASAKLVKVTPVTNQVFNHYVEIQGKVQTDLNVMVSSEPGGLLKAVKVSRGTRVKKGQVIAQTDNILIRKSIEQLQTSLELAKTMFAKQEQLWKDNVGTEVQYLQAKSQKEGLEDQMASLQEQLRKSTIVAPFNGVIEEVYKKSGEMLAPGTPVVRLVSLTDFRLLGELAETYISKINIGDPVEVYFPDINFTYKSKITVVGSTVDETNRTFRIEVKLPNHKDIKPNMIAYMKVLDYSKPNTVLVPINTVQKSATGSYIYVAENGKAARKEVTVGGTYLNTAEISTGLKEGDNVITSGYIDIVDGQPVKF